MIDPGRRLAIPWAPSLDPAARAAEGFLLLPRAGQLALAHIGDVCRWGGRYTRSRVGPIPPGITGKARKRGRGYRARGRTVRVGCPGVQRRGGIDLADLRSGREQVEESAADRRSACSGGRDQVAADEG